MWAVYCCAFGFDHRREKFWHFHVFQLLNTAKRLPQNGLWIYCTLRAERVVGCSKAGPIKHTALPQPRMENPNYRRVKTRYVCIGTRKLRTTQAKSCETVACVSKRYNISIRILVFMGLRIHTCTHLPSSRGSPDLHE